MADNYTTNPDFAMSLSVDLEQEAIHELDFLKSIDDQGKIYYDPDFIQCAIYRYETYWLPLLNKFSSGPAEDIQFAPPTDVHWVWHVHLLSPLGYRQDCKRQYKRAFGHVLTYTQSQVAKTEEKWKSLFPDVSYQLKQDQVQSTLKSMGDFQTNMGYDIAAAAQRQKLFYYQVALPHYRDSTFLKDALDRYKRFLYLKKLHKKDFLVPLYDIDLIWHTHQVHHHKYVSDCMKNLDTILPHDDSVTDRTDGSMLTNSYKNTLMLWNKIYLEDYPKFGAMYRGDPPQGNLESISPREDWLPVCT